jgi:hypothetical protein
MVMVDMVLDQLEDVVMVSMLTEMELLITMSDQVLELMLMVTELLTIELVPLLHQVQEWPMEELMEVMEVLMVVHMDIK